MCAFLNKRISTGLLCLLIIQCSVSFAQNRVPEPVGPSDGTDSVIIDFNRQIFKRSSQEGNKITLTQPVSSHANSGARVTATTGNIQITTSTTPATCGYLNGTILVTATGGTPPYTYSFDGSYFQSSRLHLVYGPGSYTVTVKDAAGETASTTVVTSSSMPPVYVLDRPSPKPSDCATKDGTLELIGLNGTPPYTFSIDNINFQSSNVFSNLAQGSYDFIIKDAKGCIGTSWSPLSSSRCYALNGWGGHLSKYTCNNDATIDMEPDAGAPPYTYSLDGIHYQSSSRFTGLGPGVYTIHVKDGNGMLYYFMANIYKLCPFFSGGTPINATCGNSDGGLVAKPTNGTPPYQYSIDGVNFQSNTVFSGLSRGYYTIVTKDATGLLATRLLLVSDNCPLAVTASVVDETCNDKNGKIKATVTGGTAPYTYSINGGAFQSSEQFNMLDQGTYTVTVRDATGNTTNTTATIVNIAGPSLGVVGITPAGCNLTGGTITITGHSGTPPYTFSIDGINYQSSGVFNVDAGDYSVFIKDANGCGHGYYPYTVGILCLQLDVNSTNTTCGNNDGSITVNGSNGSPPYVYSIDGINFQSSSIFSGLAPATYTITGKDAAGLTNTKTVTISNVCISLNLVAANATCGKPNGSIGASASNGTSPYSYSIDGINFQNNDLFTGINEGNYTVTVKDANGFRTTGNVIVGNVAGPNIACNSAPASCNNNDGSIIISGSAGTAPFSYAVNNGNFLTNATFSQLAAGNYTAMIKDANGCMATQLINVDLINTLSIDAGSDITICEGTASSLQAVSNGTSYSWTPTTGLNNASLLSPEVSPRVTTQYVVTARWGVCEKKDAVSVLVDPAPIADAGTDVAICYGQSVKLNGGGGVQYNWSPALYLDNSSVNDPTCVKPAGTTSYHLVVTDTKGCRSVTDEYVTVTVTPPAKVFAGNDTSVYIGQPCQLDAIDINNSGFTSYTWSPTNGLSDPHIKNPVAITNHNITYTVVASTINGCEGKDSISISAFAVADIFVPNAFTPNGDGRNDVLKAIPVGIKQFNYFAVFNRWGQRVFYTTDPASGWHGSINGNMLSTGTYVWVTAGTTFTGEFIERRGTVTLIR